MKPIIRLESVGYKKSNKNILSDITFELFKGDILKIIGPNGGGKTTLIQLIIGLIKPSVGKIIKNKKLSFAYMPQKMLFNIHLPLKVGDFFRLIHKNKEQDVFFKEFKIYQLLEKQLSDLSGGELQRVSFVNALLADADVMILDEPAMGLDIVGQDKLYWYLTKLNKNKGKTIIIVSHDLHIVMKATHKVICINQHICCQGTPSEIVLDKKYQNIFGSNNLLSTYEHHHNHEH